MAELACGHESNFFSGSELIPKSAAHQNSFPELAGKEVCPACAQMIRIEVNKAARANESIHIGEAESIAPFDTRKMLASAALLIAAILLVAGLPDATHQGTRWSTIGNANVFERNFIASQHRRDEDKRNSGRWKVFGGVALGAIAVTILMKKGTAKETLSEAGLAAGHESRSISGSALVSESHTHQASHPEQAGKGVDLDYIQSTRSELTAPSEIDASNRVEEVVSQMDQENRFIDAVESRGGEERRLPWLVNAQKVALLQQKSGIVLVGLGLAGLLIHQAMVWMTKLSAAVTGDLRMTAPNCTSPFFIIPATILLPIYSGAWGRYFAVLFIGTIVASILEGIGLHDYFAGLLLVAALYLDQTRLYSMVKHPESPEHAWF